MVARMLVMPAFIVGARMMIVPALAESQNSRTGGEGRVVTAQEISRSGARTAWEALQLLVPSLSLQETSTGQPRRILRRGPSTVVLPDGPLVYLDGVRLADFRALALVPAGDLAGIEILSGIDGTTRYGTDAVSGVILLFTKSAPARGPGSP
jgi:outer membrane cobalamin receptor